MRTVLVVLRQLGAWFAGVVGGALVVAGLEAASHVVWPVPADLDPSDAEAFARFVEQLPIGALVAVVVAWICGAFVGSILAAALASRVRLAVGLLAGAMTLLGTVANLAMIPHPIWMIVLGPVGVIVAMGLGAWTGTKVVGGSGRRSR